MLNNTVKCVQISICKYQSLKVFLGGMPPNPPRKACFALYLVCTWGAWSWTKSILLSPALMNDYRVSVPNHHHTWSVMKPTLEPKLSRIFFTFNLCIQAVYWLTICSRGLVRMTSNLTSISWIELHDCCYIKFLGQWYHMKSNQAKPTEWF